MQDNVTVTGRVTSGLGGRYVVAGEDGREYVLRAKGALRRDGGRVEIGDFVSLRVDAEEQGALVISAVLPRRNVLIRPPLANLDRLWLVVAAASPDPAPDTADKLLAICEHNRIEPAVFVTKSDLAPERAADLAALYRKAGFDSLVLSAETGSGVEECRRHVLSALQGGKTGAFAGASGVGKSTLIETLFPTLARETGEISRKTGRGRHTTRSVELLPLPGTDGYLADTPGFSLLDFERFDFFPLDALVGCFRDFAPYVGQCRYADCTHVKEEECAIRAAVARGDIAPSRHESYATLYAILKAKENTYK